MYDVGERPDERHAEEGNAEEDHMQHDGQQQVSQPDAATVHHLRVGVDLAVSHAHVHLGQQTTATTREDVAVLNMAALQSTQCIEIKYFIQRRANCGSLFNTSVIFIVLMKTCFFNLLNWSLKGSS